MDQEVVMLALHGFASQTTFSVCLVVHTASMHSIYHLTTDKLLNIATGHVLNYMCTYRNIISNAFPAGCWAGG